MALAAAAALPACSSISSEPEPSADRATCSVPGTSWRPGCATRRNLAALAENPADLDRPRQETARDAVRRDAVLGLYAQNRQPPGAAGAASFSPSAAKAQQ